jgi:hypothetical protein
LATATAGNCGRKFKAKYGRTKIDFF